MPQYTSIQPPIHTDAQTCTRTLLDIQGASGHSVVPVSQLVVLGSNHQPSGGLVHSGIQHTSQKREESQRGQKVYTKEKSTPEYWTQMNHDVRYKSEITAVSSKLKMCKNTDLVKMETIFRQTQALMFGQYRLNESKSRARRHHDVNGVTKTMLARVIQKTHGSRISPQTNNRNNKQPMDCKSHENTSMMKPRVSTTQPAWVI